jgi:hypothetical protein
LEIAVRPPEDWLLCDFESVVEFSEPGAEPCQSEVLFYVINVVVGEKDTLTPVPLPSGLPLLLAGLAGLTCLRRRRR